MDQRTVVAEWAWISKEPGSPEDYGVLAVSKGPIGAGRLAGAYAAGVPSSSLPGHAPGAAPWVTFGSHPAGPDWPALSISVQDPWRGQDQAGRPIWPQRFFLCRYDELAAAGVSYRTLWDVVAPVGLPRPDGQPIPLAVRPERPDDVVAAISEIGFDRAAALAAALLDGPVAVTGTAGLRLTDPALDRLAVLDAAAALLPYGFRADLSGSTAVDSTVVHRVRLVLAEYASDRQQAVPLHGAPVPLRSELAREYLAMLLDKERWDGLDAVLAHLRDAVDACSFGRPETALEILGGLNRYRYKLRTARECPEGSGLSHAFFRGEPALDEQVWRSPELDEQTRGKLLRPLLEGGDLAGIVHRHWAVVADDYTALVRDRLDHGDVGCAERGLAAAWAQPGQEADRLLGTLVGPPRAPRETGERDLAIRAELLRRCPVPKPGTFDLTRTAFLAGSPAGWQGRLVRRLLASEIVADPAGDRLLAWASWLVGPAAGGEVTGWAAAFCCLTASTDGDVGCLAVASLIKQDAAWAAITIGLAARSGRLDHVLGLPGLAADLVGQAAAAARPGQEETRRVLLSALGQALGTHGLDPAVLGAVDIARVLLGAPLSGFFGLQTRPELSRYDEGLRRILALASVRDTQPSPVTRFLGELTRADSAERLPEGTVTLLRAWSEDEGLVRELATFTAASGTAVTLAQDWRFGDDFWGRLTAVQPGLRPALAVSLLRGAVEQAIADPAALGRYADERFGVPGSGLALAMYRALRSGLSAAQILGVVRDTSVRELTLTATTGPRDLDDVLRELAFLLACPVREADGGPAADAARRIDAAGVLLDLRESICAGALGASYGAGFRRSLSRRLRDEEAASRRLRLRLRPQPRPFSRWRPRPEPSAPAVAPAGEE